MRNNYIAEAFLVGIAIIAAGGLISVAINRSADTVAKADAAALHETTRLNDSQEEITKKIKESGTRVIGPVIEVTPEPVLDSDDCRTGRTEWNSCDPKPDKEPEVDLEPEPPKPEGKVAGVEMGGRTI